MRVPSVVEYAWSRLRKEEKAFTKAKRCQPRREVLDGIDLCEEAIPSLCHGVPYPVAEQFIHKKRTAAEFHDVDQRFGTVDSLLPMASSARSEFSSRSCLFRCDEAPAKQLKTEVIVAAFDEGMERRVKEDPVTLPEKVRHAIVVRWRPEIRHENSREILSRVHRMAVQTVGLIGKRRPPISVTSSLAERGGPSRWFLSSEGEPESFGRVLALW